jgi:lipid-binding SYLF domain-containing protein
VPRAKALGTPTAAEIDRGATAALARLYRTTPAARALGEKAYAILIFPEVVKAGLMIGGEIGYGALRQGDRTVGYYRTTSASYGLQAGAQTFSYALFLMTPEARRWLDRSDGWEVGVGPSVVLVDEGMASRMTTTTVQSEIYAFVFGQSGLMAGLGVQGSKIMRIQPSR